MFVRKDLTGLFDEDVEHGCRLVTFVNPYSYYILEDSGLHHEFDFIFVDGISLVKIYNCIHKDKIKRYSFDFTSLAPIVFDFCILNELKVAIVGGSEQEVASAQRLLMSKYPNLNVVYSRNGFFNDELECLETTSEMNSLSVDVVISGMGTPKQESFLLECKNNVSSLKYGFTCGGFLSQISQNPEYFHPVFDKLNMRWAQRFFRHSYVRKRLIKDYPAFFFKYLKKNVKFGK